MSCTDKIASWCVLGLQGGLLARWFEPVYLDSIVVSGVGEPPDRGEVVGWQGSKEEWGKAIRKEAEEALYGRLSDIESTSDILSKAGDAVKLTMQRVYTFRSASPGR